MASKGKKLPQAPPRRSTSEEAKSSSSASALDLIRQPQHNFEMVIGQVCARDISHDCLSASATEIRPDSDSHASSVTAIGVIVESELSKTDDKHVGVTRFESLPANKPANQQPGLSRENRLATDGPTGTKHTK